MKIRTLILGLVLAAGFVPAVFAGKLADDLKGKLVRYENGKVAAAADVLAGKEFVAVYYSAHWCPPCRQFTPELVKFYNEAKAKYPKFELVLASADYTEADMAKYMAWGKMNFPALSFKDRGELDDLSAKGIPYLIVLDAEGKQILGKAEGEDYAPPSQILAQLKALLEKSGK